jgi:hypothetical protein
LSAIPTTPPRHALVWTLTITSSPAFMLMPDPTVVNVARAAQELGTAPHGDLGRQTGMTE